MNEHLSTLLFGLSVAFILPAVCFLLGMSRSKLVGGWQDSKFRKWWTTICLSMPFLFLGMMALRMREDGFQGMRIAWSVNPLPVAIVALFVALVSIVLVSRILHLWHISRH